MGVWNLLGGLMPPAVDTAGESERRHSRDLGAEEEFEVLNNENQDVSYAKDLRLENAILANFPDGCDRSFIVESKDEDSYDIIPKNLTFAEVISILNQAVKEDNYEKLDEVIQNIEDYEGRSITLESTNLKNFCEQQLNLDLRNNQHIYSNILSQYKFNQVELKYDYLVKELVLFAIAANDKLAEKYQDILFAEGNLSLLPLLVGGQEYIKAFIEKFHSIDEVYNKIKDQTIQLVEPNKIGFFSTIALRKEQELLETVLAEPFLRDLEHVLKTSNPDPLYGVLETASLVKNEKFITLVLNAFERYINEPTKDVKDLLKGSFVTLLETAISQEHLPIIEYLCKRYINNKGSTNYDIYEQAFADDRVIKVLNQQILKNIGARDRKKIYDLVLKTALDAGNITFIEHLCEEYAECSNDVIDYLNQKFKNNEFDNAYELALITLSNIKSKDIVIDTIAHIQIYQSISHNEQITRQVIQNILRNAVHYSTDQEDYSLVKKVCYLCTESDEISIIFREECEIFKSSIEKRMEDLERENKLLQSEALHEYNYNYVPGVINGLAQVPHAGYDIYTEDPKYNKRQENTDLVSNLIHIRNILQFSIDVQEYSCTERQDLWNQMYSTPATFIVRKKSDNTADKSAIPAITSDILSENSESQSTDSKQLQRSIVDKEENIMNNKKVSIEETIDNNNYRRGKIPKNIEEKLSNAIFALNYEEVMSLVEKVRKEDNSVDIKQILNKALEDANKTEVGKKDKESKSKLAEIKIFLEKELENIAAASPVSDDVKTTASSKKAPVVESEGSESNLASSSSEDDDFSKLESDDSPRISSDSPLFDIIYETEVPETAAEMPSMVTEGKSDDLNDEKDDQKILQYLQL
ncbi:host RNA manipulator TomO [Wolbachia endosymbiont of Protocalliphora sialia]